MRVLRISTSPLKKGYMDNTLFNPQEEVAVDTETTGLRHWQADEAFSVGMCDGDGNTWYTEWEVDPYTREVVPDYDDLDLIQNLTGDPKIKKVFHNAKFDVRMLAKHGITFSGEIHDTHIAARVCNNIELSYGLKTLAARYLKIPDSDEKALKLEVNRARRLAKSHNLVTPYKQILVGSKPEMDYWLPHYFDPTHDFCEKYCRIDTFRTMGLYLFYQDIMAKDDLLQQGYDFEMHRLWPVVNRMEGRGMRISREEVVEQNDRAHHDLETHYNNMVVIIREKGLTPFSSEDTPLKEFNPNSTPQLRRVLYLPERSGGLGLSTKRECKSGELSTDKKALREIASEPFVRELAAYRSAEQAISLFFDKYLDLMMPCPLSPGEMVLRPGLNQCGTVTFRFSSSDPNLQQVSNPRTTSDNQFASYHARAPFGPRRGYIGYAGDYAQQELRIFAEVGQINFLLNEIAIGNDPNSACANKAWGGRNNPAALKAASFALDLGREKPNSPQIEDLWQEFDWSPKAAREFGFSSHRSYQIADEWLRRHEYDIVKAEKSIGRSNSRGRAKTVVFAKIYGGGPSSVTEQLYCTLEEAKQFLADFDRESPEIRKYMNYLSSKASKDGFIVNPYGRKIRVEREFSYRAVNYMIQSTAAIMMKDSIVRCDEYFRETGKDAHVLMTIHDELLFEIKREHTHKWLLRGIFDIMSDNQGRLKVPMPVEFKRFKQSWDSKEDVEL